MISDDVYVENISIGRAIICAPLDVDADLGILYRHVMDRGLAPRVDGNTVRLAVTVNDTALEIIVRAGNIYGVKGLRRTDANYSFLFGPGVHRLELCKGRKLERNRVRRIRRSADRLREQIFSVGEEYRSLRIRQNKLLQSIRNILTRVRLNVIGNYDVHISHHFFYNLCPFLY